MKSKIAVFSLLLGTATLAVLLFAALLQVPVENIPRRCDEPVASYPFQFDVRLKANAARNIILSDAVATFWVEHDSDPASYAANCSFLVYKDVQAEVNQQGEFSSGIIAIIPTDNVHLRVSIPDCGVFEQKLDRSGYISKDNLFFVAIELNITC